MLTLTRKNRSTWFYEVARIRSPVSLVPFAVRLHLGLSASPTSRQRMYEDMNDSGLVACPLLVRYRGYDRIFFVNEALREIVQDYDDIQAARVIVRNYCYERFRDDLPDAVRAGKYNDWPPDQGWLLEQIELEFPDLCDFERIHYDAWRDLNMKKNPDDQ